MALLQGESSSCLVIYYKDMLYLAVERRDAYEDVIISGQAGIRRLSAELHPAPIASIRILQKIEAVRTTGVCAMR